MYFDEHFSFGGGPGPRCCACGAGFHANEQPERVVFTSDPKGEDGLTGDYHAECARPFASISHALDALARLRR